jgi:peptide/nickel transport system permease protein
MLIGIPLLTSIHSFIRALREIMGDSKGLAGLIMVLSIACMGFSAPYLPIPSYDSIDFPRFRSPYLEHPLGTDHLGRDLLSRVIWGARVSLMVGFVAAGIAALIGILLGTVAGYYGGIVDAIVSRITDIFFVIPTFFIAVTLAAIYGSNIALIMLIIGLTTWPVTARIMRAQVIVVKELPYVEAVKAIGANSLRIIARHIIPASIQPAIANTILQVANAVVIEAGLSYLGLGDPNLPSWGRIIYEGQPYISSAWWISIFPGIFLLITVAGLNLLGDAIYRKLTPRIGRVSGNL